MSATRTSTVLGPRIPLAEMSEERVLQRGPAGRGEFTYVDISSIDREAKRIVDPKVSGQQNLWVDSGSGSLPKFEMDPEIRTRG